MSALRHAQLEYPRAATQAAKDGVFLGLIGEDADLTVQSREGPANAGRGIMRFGSGGRARVLGDVELGYRGWKVILGKLVEEIAKDVGCRRVCLERALVPHGARSRTTVGRLSSYRERGSGPSRTFQMDALSNAPRDAYRHPFFVAWSSSTSCSFFRSTPRNGSSLMSRSFPVPDCISTLIQSTSSLVDGRLRSRGTVRSS